MNRICSTLVLCLVVITTVRPMVKTEQLQGRRSPLSLLPESPQHAPLKIIITPPAEELIAMPIMSKSTKHTTCNYSRCVGPCVLLSAIMVVSGLGYGMFTHGM